MQGTHVVPARMATSIARALLLLTALGAGPALAQGTPPPPYPFLALADAGDPLAIAMATIWNAQFDAPLTSEDAATAQVARAEAEALIAASPEQVAAHLLDALRLLDPGDVGGLTSLAPLMRQVGEDTGILDHLRALLMQSPPPRDPVSGPGDPATPAAVQFRDRALAHIAGVARGGGAEARTRLLELLESPDPAVRSGAVQGIYRSSPSRQAAQREMRRRLDPDEHHLLYRH